MCIRDRCPSGSGHQADDPVEYACKCRCGGHAIERVPYIGSKQRTDVGHEVWVVQFLEHALLGLCSGNGNPRCRQVTTKKIDDLLCIEGGERFQRMGEVNQITPLLALKQSAKLGREKFLIGECRYFGRTREPWIFYSEWPRLNRIVGFPFTGIDLDFEPYGDRR